MDSSVRRSVFERGQPSKLLALNRLGRGRALPTANVWSRLRIGSERSRALPQRGYLEDSAPGSAREEERQQREGKGDESCQGDRVTEGAVGRVCGVFVVARERRQRRRWRGERGRSGVD